MGPWLKALSRDSTINDDLYECRINDSVVHNEHKWSIHPLITDFQLRVINAPLSLDENGEKLTGDNFKSIFFNGSIFKVTKFLPNNINTLIP